MATELFGQLRHKKHLVSDQRKVQGTDVRLKGGVTTNWPKTGGKVAPAGYVVVKKTADKLYYAADDAVNGDRNAAPSITSVGHVDGNGVIKIVGSNGEISVTTATGTGTEANNVTDLNADAAFKAHYVASVVGTDIKIEARKKGEREWFYIDAATRDGCGFSEGEANKVRGTTADYRVIDAQRSLIDMDGAARDSDPVPALLAGHFKESELTGLTQEAKNVLLERGSILE